MTTQAIAFLGPSLAKAEAHSIFSSMQVWGPARQGDVLRALREQPKVIALIDGVFESQPSVWHQEIRIALSEGVHVLGASSMGALRAAELEPFGIVGVGQVFRAYAENRLIDDSDVALLHADAEHDYRPLSIPLVNVVAIAEHALAHGALKLSDARALVEAARAVHYQHRHWTTVLAQLQWSTAKKHAFEQFRKANPRDVKAEDARECIRLTRELCQRRAGREPTSIEGLSVWARRAWLEKQGDAPESDEVDGLRTLLIAEWCRSMGLQPSSERVTEFERRGAKVPLDAGLKRRFAEALALEEQVLRQPGLLAAQAPGLAEGRWVDAIRRTKRSRR
jgi:hypothetical protein